MVENHALVTGGAGFVGSHLVDRLIEEGYEVSVLDDLSTGNNGNIRPHIGNKAFKFIKGSITDKKIVRESLKGVNVVFHHAAITSVIRSISNPPLLNRINVDGTLILLDEARRSGVEKFIFASSAAVYGGSYVPPLSEDLIPRPDSPYGASKVSGEAYCASFYNTYKLGTVVLRYFNIYGERCTAGQYSGVMAHFARRLAAGRPLEVFGDGSQTRDFVYVTDVVDANIKVAKSKSAAGKTLNIGTGKRISINEVAKMFLRKMGTGERFVIYRKARQGEIKHSWASIRRARKEIDYMPKTEISEGIGKFISWYKTNR